MKPTSCTNFSNLFLEWNSTCFGQTLCPSSGVFHCTLCNPAGSVPSWFCSQAVSKPLWHIPLLCVRWKTPDDGQRNCTKHVELHSKNKFEKLMHLVGFITSICHDARSHGRKIRIKLSYIIKTVCLVHTSAILVAILTSLRMATSIDETCRRHAVFII